MGKIAPHFDDPSVPFLWGLSQRSAIMCTSLAAVAKPKKDFQEWLRTPRARFTYSAATPEFSLGMSNLQSARQTDDQRDVHRSHNQGLKDANQERMCSGAFCDRPNIARHDNLLFRSADDKSNFMAFAKSQNS
jgi:hypothetical protein